MSDKVSPSDPRKLAESLGTIIEVGKELAATVPSEFAATEELSYGAGGVEFAQQREREIHDLRKGYLPKLFRLVCAWLIVVVLLVTASSLGWITLSDKVLIAFITSTTVSVLGLFHVAGRWLYPKTVTEGRLRSKSDE